MEKKTGEIFNRKKLVISGIIKKKLWRYLWNSEPQDYKDIVTIEI